MVDSSWKTVHRDAQFNPEEPTMLVNLLFAAAQLTLGQAATDEIEGVTSDGKFLVGATSTAPDIFGVERSSWYEQVGGERTSFNEEEPDQKAAFMKWKSKVKVVPLVPGRTSPDGKATVDVVMKPKSASKDDLWVNGSEVTAVVRLGARKLELFDTSSSFTVAWTPDSRGLVVTTSEPTFLNGARGSVVPATNVSVSSWVPAAPSVNCLGPTYKLAYLASKQFGELSSIDLNVTYGVAKKKRDHTVIYFRKEQEGLAKKLGEKFAKSTTEPLTWDSPFDVVVALGGAT